MSNIVIKLTSSKDYRASGRIARLISVGVAIAFSCVNFHFIGRDEFSTVNKVPISISVGDSAKANPALAPLAPAICATGAGCVVLLTVTVTGVITYYVWQHRSNNKRILADKSGNSVLKKYEDFIDDNDPRYQGKDATQANSPQECSQIAKNLGRELLGTVKKDKGGVISWVCVFN